MLGRVGSSVGRLGLGGRQLAGIPANAILTRTSDTIVTRSGLTVVGR